MLYSTCMNCTRLQFIIKNLNHIQIKRINLNSIKQYTLFGPSIQKYSTQKKEGNQHTKEILNVYYGVLTPQIKAVKVFSLITSITGLMVQPIIYQQSSTIGGLPVLIAICSFVGFFTFVTPLLLHLITRKYVTHLDYNPSTDEYIASIVTFFLRRKTITFSVNDVHVPDVPGMFTSFIAKGTPLFVDPRLFPNPHHYARIMGYDKPIDLKLSQNNISTTNKSDKSL